MRSAPGLARNSVNRCTVSARLNAPRGCFPSASGGQRCSRLAGIPPTTGGAPQQDAPRTARVTPSRLPPPRKDGSPFNHPPPPRRCWPSAFPVRRVGKDYAAGLAGGDKFWNIARSNIKRV